MKETRAQKGFFYSLNAAHQRRRKAAQLLRKRKV
jgi:hypothetical protein